MMLQDFYREQQTPQQDSGAQPQCVPMYLQTKSVPGFSNNLEEYENTVIYGEKRSLAISKCQVYVRCQKCFKCDVAIFLTIFLSMKLWTYFLLHSKNILRIGK